ncbi:MAG: amidohydrolase family protein [Ancrocorticia sp.]|jgi:imidazolonepropionase-like amidohydrolase|nr:amidohydrolase family protein [Ancrocorticia sp.]
MSTTVVSAARIITGKPNEVIDDGALVYRGATILWVGRVAELPQEYAALPRRDFPGATIQPGFVETHAHLGTRPGEGPHVPDPTRHVQGWNALHSVAVLRQLASTGITSAQSLGSRFYTDVAVREAVEQGYLDGPRIVAAGPMITTTGGHDWVDGGEVDSLDDIRHAVRDHHKAGVDVIKMAVTGGFFTPGTAQWKAQFTVDEIRTLVEEAHRLGKRVAVHAHGTQGIERAVEAGVDYIAHATFISDDGTTQFVPQLADRIAEAGIYVDVAAPPSFPRVPGETIAPRARELYERGVRIVTGHDIGAVIPAYGYIFGLKELERAGIPRAEILIAATSRAAAAIGLAGVTGVLEPQYAADFLVVQGNPLENLDALDTRLLTVIRGKEFHPDPLPKYCGRVEEPGKPHRPESELAKRQRTLERQHLQQW